nr:MAG TPA: Alcohol dehydrogenase GroES-like domain [Caudoviricetes sp.]
MEELKVGQKVTLEAIEQDVCNGCDDCFFGYDDTCYNRPIMVGVMDFCVNLKNVLTENM